jgi:elongator complex protein 1
MREYSAHFVTRFRLWVTTRGNYRKAFLTCRKHRIDLNVIVDRDPKLFTDRLSSFIEQVHDVDYINLFLTNLGSVAFLDLPTGLLIMVCSQTEFAATRGNI